MGPELGPVFGASEYWHVSRGLRKRSHFGACILVLANHFRAHFFGIAQSGRGATISSATCSRRTPKCSQLICLEHVFVSNNQVETCCILTKRSANRGGPLWCTRFRRVFRSRKWVRGFEQKPGEDVVWQRFSQTRQDTVVGVFRWSHPTESATRRLCGLFSASPHPP